MSRHETPIDDDAMLCASSEFDLALAGVDLAEYCPSLFDGGAQQEAVEALAIEFVEERQAENVDGTIATALEMAVELITTGKLDGKYTMVVRNGRTERERLAKTRERLATVKADVRETIKRLQKEDSFLVEYQHELECRAAELLERWEAPGQEYSPVGAFEAAARKMVARCN